MKLYILILVLSLYSTIESYGQLYPRGFRVLKMPDFISRSIPASFVNTRLINIKQPQIESILNQICPINSKKESGEIIIIDLSSFFSITFEILPQELKYIRAKRADVKQNYIKTTANLGYAVNEKEIKQNDLNDTTNNLPLSRFKWNPVVDTDSTNKYANLTPVFSNLTVPSNSVSDWSQYLNNLGNTYNSFIGESKRSSVMIGNYNAFVDVNTIGTGNTFIGQLGGYSINDGLVSEFIGNQNVSIGYKRTYDPAPSIAENVSIWRLARIVNVPLQKSTKFLTVNENGDVIIGDNIGTLNGNANTFRFIVNNVIDNSSEKLTTVPGVFTIPAGYNLYVANGVLTEKVKVALTNTNDWSDKVFSTNYKYSLDGIPSSKELSNNSVDVGKMEAKLLEKVEEITLYMIELKKQKESITRLKKQINMLKWQIKVSDSKKHQLQRINKPKKSGKRL